MKKATLILGAFLTLFIISCEGPAGFDGRDGAPGQDGLDGALFEAAAFEIERDFVLNATDNSYEYGPEEYPSDISLLKDDVVLIYRLEEVNDGLDVWRQLPQPFFAEDGLMFYNFDFTQADFGLFVEPEFDVNLIALELVQAQVFRIVVIPGDLGTSSKMDKSNIYSVLDALGIEEKDIKKVN